MSGIAAYVGHRAAWPMVVAGLKAMEHRRYDSVGVATISRRRLRLARHVGRLAGLERHHGDGLPGRVGLGHLRWATHGEVSEANCHPHVDPSGEVAVVHNGILDNAEVLRERLMGQGVVFGSQTDSEVLAHLIAQALQDGAGDLVEAVRAALQQVRGTAGVVAVCRRQPELLVAAAVGSPMFIGLGEGESWVASEAGALAPWTERVVSLDDGQLAAVGAGGVRLVDLARRDRAARLEALDTRPRAPQGHHAHHMLREIEEQPRVLDRTLRGRLDDETASSRLAGLDELGRRIFELRRVALFGCGSSLHAAEVGRHLLERHARVPALAEDAAELLGRNPMVRADTLYVAVSQSGETADTLAALREINARGGLTAGITNVPDSSMARETACGVHLHAGAERSVCSTKAFTAQIAALTLLSLRLARVGHMAPAQGRAWIEALRALPGLVGEVLALGPRLRAVAEARRDARFWMVVGRGACAPIAREGALKLQEIAYLPAAGFSGAALRHGPLALVTPGSPVWVLVPPDEGRREILEDLAVLKDCGASVTALATAGDAEVAALADEVLPLPPHHPILTPMLSVIPLQLLAYHLGASLGHPIDTPRHLTRAVTGDPRAR